MLQRIKSRVKKFGAGLALLSVETIVILAVFTASLAALFFITRRVFLLHNDDLDKKVFDAVKPYINDTNTKVMNVITFFGKHQFLIPANLLLIAYFLFIKKHKWYSIKVPAIAISSLLLMFGLKHLFARHRPTNQLLQEATNYSYPSGHALMSVTFYGLLAYMVWHSEKSKGTKWTVISLLVVWILLIGASRIYLRRHYYSDVIAGLATGFLWLVISLNVMNRLEKQGRKKLNLVVQQPAPQDV